MKKVFILILVLALIGEVASAELEIQNERNVESIVLKTGEGKFNITDIYSTNEKGKFEFNNLCLPSKDISVFTVKLGKDTLTTYKKDDIFISLDKKVVFFMSKYFVFVALFCAAEFLYEDIIPVIGEIPDFVDHGF